MKYIHFKDSGFVVFEDIVVHVDMARRFKPDEPFSAGQVTEDGRCWGESATLGIGSHVDDTRELARAMRRMS